ncbi:MAG: FtsX-like permease family protein [Gammaproteobacteria bacterium]|nr:FtsX-like permease family protein [Gammaproteobacteria bacterium]
MAEIALPTATPSRPKVRIGSHLFAIAWRNLWRNRRRTWLTAGGIAFAVWMLIFARSMQDGTFIIMIDNAARMMTGHIQVQHPDYQDDPRVEHTLEQATQIAEQVAAHPAVEQASLRAQAFALVSFGERSFGAQVMGVEPEKEIGWSTLANMQVEGRYLEKSGDAFLGSVLARNLGLGLGDEIVLLGSAKEGGVAAVVATVVGTFTSGQAAIDRALVQITLNDFREGWELSPNEAHAVIAVTNAVTGSNEVARAFDGPNRVSLGWTDLMPEVEQMVEMKRIGTEMFFVLIAVIVTFSVVNTFMMTVFERTPEFGMLMAIGMRPGSIMLQLFVEAFWLCTLGLVLGVGISAVMVAITGATGIPLPAEATEMLANYNLPDRMYPAFSLDAAIVASIAMYIGTQLAALIPALRVQRMRPVEALRAQE